MMLSKAHYSSFHAWVSEAGSGEITGLYRLLRRKRVQLLGGLIIAVLLPGLLHWHAGLVESVSDSALTNSVLGSACALTAGYFILRQLAAYPGVNATVYIMPVFALTFASLVAVMFGLRMGYSPYQIAASFVLSLVWFYCLFLAISRRHRLRMALVPEGNLRQIEKIGGIQWIRLDKPSAQMRDFDALIADLHAVLPDEWEHFITQVALTGVPVYTIKQAEESLTGRVAVEHFSENTFSSALPSMLYRKAKRAVDLIVALMVLPLAAPILGLCALLIRLESPGPALFVQTRTGYRGKPFKIYKLRTMREGAEAEAAYTEDDDQRITRLGAILRKYRIDEVPQIINILRGEMSWIGPRPEAISLAQWYEREVPFYAYRHLVRPGITGWAQVNQGNVAKIDAATEKLHYDFYYIKNFSPWLDALIVARTIHTILTGFGSR